MSSFNYTAKDKTGSLKNGIIQALDRSSAASSLLEKGLVPVLIKENGTGPSGAKRGLLSGLLGNKVKLQDKVIFSRQFATMINAGVPIVQSLAILREQTESKKLGLALRHVSTQVEGGSTLANALEAHADVFSPIYINMVRAGETGGILDQVLDRLAIQQEKDAEIVGKVKGAMIYPAVITTATIAAFFFLMTVIVPKLGAIFKDLGGELPIYTKIMLGISDVLVHQGIFIIAGFGVAGFVAVRWAKTPGGKKKIDYTLIKLPIIGPILVKVNVARFSRTFGSLMASGISVLEAINATASALGNTAYKDDLHEVALQVKNGKPMSEPLKASKHFPAIVAQMVAVGEETGQLDEILLKLAAFYEKEVDSVVEGLTSIIEPILIIVLGGMVGFIVISVFGPLSNISNSV